MIRRGLFALAGFVSLLACTAKDTGHAPGSAGEAPLACEGVGSVADMSYALSGATLRDASTNRHALSQVDEMLGYLANLDRRLGTGRGHESLRHDADQLTRELRARRDAIEAAMDDTRESYESSKAGLDAAADCSGIDLRDDATSAPKRCRGAVRLWTAAGQVNLTSAVDTRSVAQHIRELRLDEETAKTRDSLAASLLTHAQHLEALAEAVAPEDDETKLAQLKHELQQSLDETMRTCLSAMPGTGRIESGGAKPRQATVVVHPKYSGPVEEIFGDASSFGSGFVVQWRTAEGGVETRIVTNEHVMSGAREAEIHVGDDAKKATAPKADEPDPIRATLVRSLPYDDIAILRVEDSPRARELLAKGLGFRRTPIEDQEPIVAAGFPGVGSMPSYQVSEGTVSNARFGGQDGDDIGVTGYIQHTAAIDPGNSGGPLLDAKGNVVGVNTLKLVGRENVGLAIPVARVQFAMSRADETAEFTVAHAHAACNLAVASLSADAPAVGALDRFSLELYEPLAQRVGAAKAVEYRNAVGGRAYTAAERVRSRIYGALRASLDAEDGVAPYTRCTNVEATTDGRFTARAATRKGTLRITLAPEDGLLRVAEVEATH